MLVHLVTKNYFSFVKFLFISLFYESMLIFVFSMKSESNSDEEDEVEEQSDIATGVFNDIQK